MKECKGELIRLANSPLDYCKYESFGTIFYEFDSSEEESPTPMIAALAGLELIDTPDKRLIMINHIEPVGLFAKISSKFNYKINELKNGNFEIIFSLK